MTDAAVMVIGDALTKLAIARGGRPDAYTGSVYLERLERFDPDLVARACGQLSDEPRGDYETALPDVGRIIERVKQLEQADQAEAARRRILPAPKWNEREPTFHCSLCLDEPSAWRLFWCPGKGPERTLDIPARAAGTSMYPCSRFTDHPGHTFADRCECSDTNPVIAKHRERIAAARPKQIAGKRQRSGE